MVVVTVTYPTLDGSSFDLDYYREKHIALVQARWGSLGLTDATYINGLSMPGGGAIAYHLIALLSFESEQAFQKAAQAHGKEIMSDVKNFTTAEPIVQINEQLKSR